MHKQLHGVYHNAAYKSLTNLMLAEHLYLQLLLMPVHFNTTYHHVVYGTLVKQQIIK